MTIPGVQKPHWLAPVAEKASTQLCRQAGSRPSSVVTERPATRLIGVTQATLGAPSIHTVQHPHWPWGLQPSFAVRRPSRSRSTSRREDPSSGTSTRRPSTTRPSERSGEPARSGVDGVTNGDPGRPGQLKDEPHPQVRVALGLVM